MDWDNLRYFLELARAGTLVGAARRLAVDHTTVARRLQALEKQVGSRLFAREAGGHRLTEAGRALLPQVEAMEAAFLAVENATPGVRQGLHGLVRIGTTEGFGNLILAPQLARLVEYGASPRAAIAFARASRAAALLAVWLAEGGGSSLRVRDRTTCGSRSHSAPCRPTDSPDGESPVADTDALPARALRWSPDSCSDNRIPARR